MDGRHAMDDADKLRAKADVVLAACGVAKGDKVRAPDGAEGVIIKGYVWEPADDLNGDHLEVFFCLEEGGRYYKASELEKVG